ncbi:hypothetical protein ACWKSP_28755 [Micromonosporaceae bacterium Da 78-11]
MPRGALAASGHLGRWIGEAALTGTLSGVVIRADGMRFVEAGSQLRLSGSVERAPSRWRDWAPPDGVRGRDRRGGRVGVRADRHRTAGDRWFLGGRDRVAPGGGRGAG